jgi:hypothetical protein
MRGVSGILLKRLAATLTIGVFLFSTLAILAPVQAHFTLGLNTPDYPYQVDDFDPHVPGVIGYVWPGGGENTYLGAPSSVTNVVSPGYVPPYPSQSIAYAQSYGGGAGWTQNLEQLDGHEYAPFGAIVTGTTGDLIFAVNATYGVHDNFGTFGFSGGSWSDIFIAIPPEFGVPDTSQIVTTITNNYVNILKYTASSFDRYVPGWTIIRIIADPQYDIRFTYVPESQWYYVRVNGVTAPSVAGKYFFKMFFRGIGEDYWVPTPNWPVLLVKGELDPAIITGTIRYGGYNATLYGEAMKEAGMVWAKMITKTDPYTGSTIGTCPDHTSPTGAFDHSTGCYDAWGFFNGTTIDEEGNPVRGANGHFEVEGVAPGVYDLYAEAAGYPLDLIASGVTVLKGQSLHFDGYLNPGPVIHGNVYSKHAFGAEPWPENSYIKIELYDAPTVSHVPASNATLVSWSPLPCVAGGQEWYVAGYDAAACGDPRSNLGQPRSNGIAFPWFEWTAGSAGGTAGVYYDLSYPYGTDPQGVGPPQTWYVMADGTNDVFHYEFGAKGMFGAPRDLDGHVPQVFATWVNGLTAGRYYVRAWVFRYVQSALDGSTFQEYSFDVTPKEWAGDISVPLDLRISSWVNKTVHFHNNAGTLVPSSINTGAQYIVGKLVDAQTGTLYAYNATTINYQPNPWDPAGLNQYCNTPGRPEFGSCNIQFWGFNDTWLGENYGIPAGTYKPMVYVMGYLQQTQDLVSVTLSGTPISISNHLYRGVGFNFTVYSIDWERPRVNRNWVWPYQEVEIAIYDANFSYVSQVCDFCDTSFAGRGVFVGGPPYWGDGNSFRYALGSGGLAILATQGPEGSIPGAGDYYVEFEGKGWDVLPNDGAAGAFFGLETSRNTRIGGRMASTGSGAHHTPWSSSNSPNYMYVGFTTGSAKNAWRLSFYTPSAFDSGQYCFQGWTYGYIQDKDFCAYANKGQVLDIKINLIVGVNVTVDVLFKKEHLISGTPYDMSARVRVFDDNGHLVATWMSSEGVYVTGSGHATAAYHVSSTVDYYNFDGGYNFLPAGTNLLHVQMAGLPLDSFNTIGIGYGDPVFTPGSGDFEVDNWPADYWSAPNAYFPNQGILGSPDYTGTGWTVEVDFVNWYYGFPGSIYTYGNDMPLEMWHTWYPVVPGLLMGESYHIIPGTQAQSGISYTEDNALGLTSGSGLFSFSHSMAANHLGPYSQRGVWQLGTAHLSGEVSGEWEVDLNGYATGTALAFTWSNELRTLSWYTVTVTGAEGMVGSPFMAYTNDGIYEFYLLPGTYSMTLAGPGYVPTPMGTIAVTEGQTGVPGSGNNVGLPPSNIPVPEFSGMAIVVFSALAASLYLLRRKRP